GEPSHTHPCGNFAVLVDLHVLPLGGQEDTSWFTTDHIEEVTSLVRDAVDHRVKQYTEFLHNRRQPKQKKELPPVSTFFTELSEQSRSEYFSSVGETQELLNSSTKTKKAVLQKIQRGHSSISSYPFILFNFFRAKQASVQRELSGSTMVDQQIDQRASPKNSRPEIKAGEPELSPTQKQEQQGENNPPDTINGASVGFCQHKIVQETNKNKRCKPSDAGDDPHSQRAKRTCLEQPPTTMQTHSTECSTQTSKHDLLPLPPSPLLEAKAESKAFPVSECKKTTLEVELLTPGKRAQRLPLTSNNTAQTNQNRLAASLRGLSVKPASSGSSIGSRSTLGEEGSENVPRTSRLRRLKRS
uniref:SLX4 interacting protein n=1 Tax=Acanthochromis polyacanthus TaxID=80966 RepID=A0A3Q1GAZ9_9TELE